MDVFQFGHSLLSFFSELQTQVQQVVKNILTIMLFLQVCNTFRDLEESNILQPYMSDAIIEISKACEAFEVKESAPSIAGIF